MTTFKCCLGSIKCMNAGSGYNSPMEKVAKN